MRLSDYQLKNVSYLYFDDIPFILHPAQGISLLEADLIHNRQACRASAKRSDSIPALISDLKNGRCVYVKSFSPSPELLGVVDSRGTPIYGLPLLLQTRLTHLIDGNIERPTPWYSGGEVNDAAAEKQGSARVLSNESSTRTLSEVQARKIMWGATQKTQPPTKFQWGNESFASDKGDVTEILEAADSFFGITDTVKTVQSLDVNAPIAETLSSLAYLGARHISRKIPAPIENAVVEVTTNGVGKYVIGPYNEIKRTASGLDAHHAGQKAAMKKLVDGYDPNTGPSILVPKIGHTIKGPNGILSRSTKGIDNARDLIARDVKELRRVYSDVPNRQLQTLIHLNKEMYPPAFKK